MTCTSAPDITDNLGQSRPLPYSIMTTPTPLIRMDQVLDRLLDPHRVDGDGPGGHVSNPYRPSAVKPPTRAGVDLTATWGGELRVQNEALVDENACAREQTLRDLERLNAAGTAKHGVRGSYNQEQTNYVVTCSGDMRPKAELSEDDIRVPSFLRNRPKMPFRRMQVPGMRPETGRSFSSSAESFAYMEMEYAAISDCFAGDITTPSSYTSSDISSVAGKKRNTLGKSKMAKCVKNIATWGKPQKQSGGVRDTPAIKEDRDYNYANDSLTTSTSSLLAKGNCFMCLGGIQPTKHSFEAGKTVGPAIANAPPVKPADIKSILLTTSPLYGDVHQTPRSQINDLVYSTQRSLNIAATHTTTTKNDTDSEDESEEPDREKDVTEIWEDETDDESDHEGRDDGCPLKHWKTTRAETWEPPVLKTDQEYEMYQLQSRMEAETKARRRLARPQMSPMREGYSPQPSFIYSADELQDSSSVSSWDVKSIRDRARSKRALSHGSSSWSELGIDGQSVVSGRSGFNNSRYR